jgi:hypothetical protein
MSTKVTSPRQVASERSELATTASPQKNMRNVCVCISKEKNISLHKITSDMSTSIYTIYYSILFYSIIIIIIVLYWYSGTDVGIYEDIFLCGVLA